MRFHPPSPVRVPLSVPGICRPLRVAHLTDLHAGMVTPGRLLFEAVDLANAAEPDFVALTGDYVSRSLNHLDVLVRALEGLAAPAVAVLGNHDHWCGADEVADALLSVGISVLRNQTIEIAGVRVVGLDDGVSGHADVAMATAGIAGPALALSHDPKCAPSLWEAGIPLVLSGHTHAGQIHVDRLSPSVWASVGVKFLHGTYGEPGRQLYVGAGVGAAVVPWRTGKGRREVGILEITGGGAER